jgi:hypothetical protein
MKNEPAGIRQAGGWLGPRPVTEGRGRRRDPSGSRPAVEIYGWQIREKPLSIKIPIDVVQRLQDDIQYGLGMSTSCDVVGLLLGRVATEYSSSIIVQDYDLAAYTNERADSGLWSNARLAEMVQPWNKLNSSLYVVGFFRSQRGEWPAIEKGDLKGAKRLLRRTPNIFLLIRSGLSRSHAGRLFVRPSRRARLDQEYGEFPLNADILRAQWNATAPKPEQTAMHFIPGNPLEGRQRMDSPTDAPEALEAVFELVPPDVPVFDISNSGVFVEAPLTNATLESAGPIASDVPAEPPKRTFWDKLFGPAISVPRVEPIAATSPTSAANAGLESDVPSELPKQQSLWDELLTPATEEPTPVEPVAAASAEAPSVEPIAASSDEVTQSEVAPELPKRTLWDKVFRPATVEEPSVETIAAIIDEVLHSDVAPESGKRTLWDKFFRPDSAEAPQVEPIAAAYLAEDLGEVAHSSESAEPIAEKLRPPALSWPSRLSIAATWTLAVGVTIWFLDRPSPVSLPPATVSEPRPTIVSNPIRLQVDRAGGLLEIVWDPTLATAMTSRGGFLTIRDGSLLKAVHLDSVEMQSGHVYYGPRSADLGIRMEVALEDGETASESVRVVGAPVAASRRLQ